MLVGPTTPPVKKEKATLHHHRLWLQGAGGKGMSPRNRLPTPPTTTTGG